MQCWLRWAGRRKQRKRKGRVLQRFVIVTQEVALENRGGMSTWSGHPTGADQAALGAMHRPLRRLAAAPGLPDELVHAHYRALALASPGLLSSTIR
jgi:hypothetical protein